MLSTAWSSGLLFMAQSSSLFGYNEQMVKVIWHTAASPSHMDSSIVFDRWRPCDPTDLARFSRFSQLTADSPYTLQWAALLPLKIKLPITTGDMDTHIIHGSLGPSESTAHTASRSVQPFLHSSRSWWTDRQTDHTTRSITIGHIYTLLRWCLKMTLINVHLL